MAIIVPTVLATTPAEYAKMLAKAKGVSRRVHIDICDGRFADNRTVGLPQVHSEEDLAIDFHLMIEDPAAQLETALSVKPHLIIVHAESSGDIAGCIAHVQELGVQAGLALLPQTPVESAAELIALVDHVLIFTGTKLGWNVGEFQENQLERVAPIRAINPQIVVSVDGGVNDTNIGHIAATGVDVMNVGGFIQNARDPRDAYRTLSGLAGVTA